MIKGVYPYCHVYITYWFVSEWHHLTTWIFNKIRWTVWINPITGHAPWPLVILHEEKWIIMSRITWLLFARSHVMLYWITWPLLATYVIKTHVVLESHYMVPVAYVIIKGHNRICVIEYAFFTTFTPFSNQNKKMHTFIGIYTLTHVLYTHWHMYIHIPIHTHTHIIITPLLCIVTFISWNNMCTVLWILLRVKNCKL